MYLSGLYPVQISDWLSTKAFRNFPQFLKTNASTIPSKQTTIAFFQLLLTKHSKFYIFNNWKSKISQLKTIRPKRWRNTVSCSKWQCHKLCDLHSFQATSWPPLLCSDTSFCNLMISLFAKLHYLSHLNYGRKEGLSSHCEIKRK
jgi:hypothetical protein